MFEKNMAVSHQDTLPYGTPRRIRLGSSMFMVLATVQVSDISNWKRAVSN